MKQFCEKIELFMIWEYRHCVKDSFYEHCRIIVDSAVMTENWWVDVQSAASVECVMHLSHKYYYYSLSFWMRSKLWE